jgi:hypothetical protein
MATTAKLPFTDDHNKTFAHWHDAIKDHLDLSFCQVNHDSFVSNIEAIR